MSHDVIIVGARCAGATLGALLARSGVKTLMLDAQAMPSGMPMSTHYLQAPGMDVLDQIGVGDAIRACTPATLRFRLRVERHDAFIEQPADRAGYCPRRSTLDPLIQQAAVKAGAELRDRSRVVDLLRDGQRVTGVVVQTARGRETLRADLVVGADGRHSTIAKLTGVEEYLSFPMTRSGYWFYFPTPAIWHEDPRYTGWQAYMGYQGDGLRYVFQCDGNVLLMAAVPPAAEMQGWKGAYKAKTLEYLRRDEVTRPLVEASRPLGKGTGLLKAQFFYRRPIGPGFALVGDAGNFKDFVTAHGMSDALISARLLHQAILKGTDAAFERYWRERDVESLPLYFDALRLGEVGVNNLATQMSVEALGRSPALMSRMAAIADRKVSPLEAFSPVELLRLAGSVLLRGGLGVIPPFLKAGRQVIDLKRELARRQRLLKRLDF